MVKNNIILLCLIISSTLFHQTNTMKQDPNTSGIPDFGFAALLAFDLKEKLHRETQYGFYYQPQSNQNEQSTQPKQHQEGFAIPQTTLIPPAAPPRNIVPTEKRNIKKKKLIPKRKRKKNKSSSKPLVSTTDKKSIYEGKYKDYITVTKHHWQCDTCKKTFKLPVNNVGEHLSTHGIFLVIRKKDTKYSKLERNEKNKLKCPYRLCEYASKRGNMVVHHIHKEHDEDFDLTTYDPTQPLGATIVDTPRSGRKRKRKHHDIGKKRKKRKRTI